MRKIFALYNERLCARIHAQRAKSLSHQPLIILYPLFWVLKNYNPL